MAINPESQYPGKIEPSTPDYPYGEARNVTVPGDGTGTPFDAALLNDLFGFQQALLSAAGLVPSENPDKVGASQYLDAIKALTIHAYPDVSTMQADDIAAGNFVVIKGLATAGDGEPRFFFIKTSAAHGGSGDGERDFDTNNGNVAVAQIPGDNQFVPGIQSNTLLRNVKANSATRFHIEPSGEILSGTVSKQDWMFDPYNDDIDNYRIFGTFLQTGDQSGNGRNAEANFTLKSVGDFYGGFPLGMWGYQDNSADRAIAMKQFYFDIDETEKPTPNLGRWAQGRTVSIGDYVQSNDPNASPNPFYGLYKATTAGTAGSTQPVHTSGTASDGGVTWEFIKDYYASAAANKLNAMMLFGRRSDYPVANGHNYTAQFARGFGIHQGEDAAHFDSDGTLAGRRVATGSDIYDYYKGGAHYHRHTDSFTQHVGGSTILSTKTVTNDEGGTGITVDARGTDVLILGHTTPTTISSILCDPNQFFRIRVVNADQVTLNNGGSLRMVNGTQLLGVRSVLSFFARSGNQAIEDGYVGS